MLVEISDWAEMYGIGEKLRINVINKCVINK